MADRLWKVAVQAPLDELLTYNEGDLNLERGLTVQVPLRNQKVRGLVIHQESSKNLAYVPKNVIKIEDDYPALHESFVRWLEWLGNYYIHPPGLVTASLYPPLDKVTQRKSNKSPVIPSLERDHAPELSVEQRNAIDEVALGSFGAYLLFGVTGSGKTEVYLNLLLKTIQSGQRGLVLVPEISLTPQLLQRFVRRFGDQVAVIHSHLTEREKTNQWWSIVRGEKNILIGARSALFCPINNLGLIVVDEEHEPSFKQDEKLRYHGRDSALMLAHLSSCPVVLGSATPSLESWHNALNKKYKLLELTKRQGSLALPEVEVVSLQKERTLRIDGKQPPSLSWLSEPLRQKMEMHLNSNHQVALLLNRRGLAPLVFCSLCGHSRKCPNCDISLTLHFQNHLICHYCDYHENRIQQCPDCKEGLLEPLGLGTEKVEEEMKKIFPNKRIRRADRDEITTREDLESLIQDMENNNIDILVGTQMIAKGLDFPNLKLVGLILADIGFNIPDFRSSERSFQLLTQMAGRAGRHHTLGALPGEVIIQAHNTDHDSLKYACNHDYAGFAQGELKHRHELRYPPYSRLGTLRIQSADSHRGRSVGIRLAETAQSLVNKHPAYKDIEILGPSEAPLAKLRNQYRFHILFKASKSSTLNKFLRQILHSADWLPTGVKVSVDVDPLMLV